MNLQLTSINLKKINADENLINLYNPDKFHITLDYKYNRNEIQQIIKSKSQIIYYNDEEYYWLNDSIINYITDFKWNISLKQEITNNEKNYILHRQLLIDIYFFTPFMFDIILKQSNECDLIKTYEIYNENKIIFNNLRHYKYMDLEELLPVNYELYMHVIDYIEALLKKNYLFDILKII